MDETTHDAPAPAAEAAPAPTPAPAPAPAAPAPVKPSISTFAEKLAVLVSRETYPIVVEYGDGHIRVSPRTATKPLIRRLLPDTLPPGLTLVAR